MKTWFSINNSNSSAAEVCIYDDIGAWGITAKDFITALAGVGNKRILLRINSDGGEIFDGLAIYNRLKSHAGGVDVVIDGLAASMASVIAMAGETITMPDNAWMMIHNPNSGVIGEASDMREMADLLDRVRNSLLSIYRTKTGIEDDKLIPMLDDETWLDAATAKELGFADVISDPVRLAAKFDSKRFKNAPPVERLKLNQTQPDMILRASILAALGLTETADKPLTDTAIMAEFNKSLGLGLTAVSDIATVRNELATTKGQLTTAQADVTRLTGELTTEKNAAQTARAERTQFITDIKTGLQLTDEHIGKLGTDKTIIPAAIQTLAMNKAIEIAAAQGVPPILKDFGGEEPPKEMKWADFRNLTIEAQNQFMRTGGKIKG